jgi:hypothetical protein
MTEAHHGRSDGWHLTVPGQWIIFYCALSFTLLGIDAALHHLSFGAASRNLTAYLPIIFAPVAGILCVMAALSRKFMPAVWVVGVFGLAIGAIGTMIHLYLNIAQRGELSVWTALAFGGRPPLAPAGFAATGILLLLVTLAGWRARVRSQGNS